MTLIYFIFEDFIYLFTYFGERVLVGREAGGRERERISSRLPDVELNLITLRL